MAGSEFIPESGRKVPKGATSGGDVYNSDQQVEVEIASSGGWIPESGRKVPKGATSGGDIYNSDPSGKLEVVSEDVGEQFQTASHALNGIDDNNTFDNVPKPPMV